MEQATDSTVNILRTSVAFGSQIKAPVVRVRGLLSAHIGTMPLHVRKS